MKLDSVLEKHYINKINYLNIDVEGNELNTLKGFSLNKYNPDLVSIEIHDKNCPPLTNKIYKYFLDRKYTLISIYGWTYFFSKNNINVYIDVVVKGLPPTKRGCMLKTLLNFSLDI